MAAEESTLWGVPTKYLVIPLAGVVMYFVMHEFQQGQEGYDPRSVEVIERLTSIEQKLNFLDENMDLLSERIEDLYTGHTEATRDRYTGTEATRDFGRIEQRLDALERWRAREEQ